MKDKWIRIFSIPLYSIFSTMIHRSADDPGTFKSIAFDFLISFIFSLTLWEGNRAILIWMRRLLPTSSQTVKRVIIQSLANIIYTFFITIAICFTFLQFGIEICGGVGNWFYTGAENLIPTLFIISIYESVYFFSEWKKNLQRSEALAKESIRSQLEALKNQLDPHFLFNSLNTLASLIHDDNRPAQTYLEQLSDVYRYVLLSRNKEMVSLQEELTFVDSYIYLNKIRFRDNLRVEMDIDEEAKNQLVAPLSIQMLVENAFKHNIISKEHPLQLKLFTNDQGYVTVENNIQKKNILEKPTKMGLQNIINRYALLTTRKIEIIANQDLFSVKLPLLTST